MQLKVEFNDRSLTRQQCMLCQQTFESKEARVIVCSSKDDEYGDACPRCIQMGFHWMQNQLLKLQVFDGKQNGIVNPA